MIFARLFGGLGNQMFQYAAGQALATRLGTKLALDFRSIENNGTRPLTEVFDLDITPAPSLPPAKHDGILRYGLWRVFGSDPRFQREKDLGYNSGFAQWTDNSYLHGYWQSEQYFAEIADHLRQVFQPTPAPSPENAAIADHINLTTSVSLHVRRGDYLAVGAHGVCSEDYYNAAIEHIAARQIGRPTIFVFSDDPQWAHDNLPLRFEKVVVDINGPKTDFEDLRLMSLCQHNIIANSSFSWWGAWLNNNPEKIVAAPTDWFAAKGMQNPDILPNDWHRISA
ncbi:Glycosyl transferase family 11 [Shimia gijangensis]|uniref:Glycosyl transferase family 11 n=1 Tax=Shimia gijangensis TaxID=1470563 RepID=A0A1M6B4U9_9RHOB|nr:alpha-1,2-fucosyltransferase [Shimia gijangensis]SHI43784.1 Glycosyl transferase family 11 [Shimia gijangensis]